MTGEEIRLRVDALVMNLLNRQPGNSVPDELTLLAEGGGFDSITALRLLLLIEKEFGIVVEDKDIQPENFKSPTSLTRYIQRKLAL